MLTIAMAAIGGGTTWVANRNPAAAGVAACVFSIVPYVYVRLKYRRRVKQITEQFPDALEMLTSTLRSGQAFATGLMTIADEMPDPIASEFRKTFEEQNFGVAMNEALLHMAERVGTMDIDFFVTAVNIQRETGGNLAEILDNLSRTIRQRFAMLGRIKALTAQGRLSGFVVGLLPVGLGVLMFILNPDYMMQLFNSPMGKVALGVSVGMQLIGFFWINKIVKVKL
jgi:tight adherence protein B